MFKITFCLRRKPELSLEAFQDYWRNQHGPLVRRHKKALGMIRYVQSHRVETPFDGAMQKPRGAPEAYDGVAELWWESRAAFEKSMADPEARAAGRELLADEKTFIDLENSPIWFAEEHTVVGESAG